MTPSVAYEALLLGVSATKPQIKAAYHRLSLLYHPDKGGDVESFTRIKDAYDFLTGAEVSCTG